MLPAWGPIVAAESRKPARCFSSPIREELKKTQEKTDGFASVAQRPSRGGLASCQQTEGLRMARHIVHSKDLNPLEMHRE